MAVMHHCAALGIESALNWMILELNAKAGGRAGYLSRHMLVTSVAGLLVRVVFQLGL